MTTNEAIAPRIQRLFLEWVEPAVTATIDATAPGSRREAYWAHLCGPAAGAPIHQVRQVVRRGGAIPGCKPCEAVRDGRTLTALSETDPANWRPVLDAVARAGGPTAVQAAYAGGANAVRLAWDACGHTETRRLTVEEPPTCGRCASVRTPAQAARRRLTYAQAQAMREQQGFLGVVRVPIVGGHTPTSIRTMHLVQAGEVKVTYHTTCLERDAEGKVEHRFHCTHPDVSTTTTVTVPLEAPEGTRYNLDLIPTRERSEAIHGHGKQIIKVHQILWVFDCPQGHGMVAARPEDALAGKVCSFCITLQVWVDWTEIITDRTDENGVDVGVRVRHVAPKVTPVQPVEAFTGEGEQWSLDGLDEDFEMWALGDDS